jgi:hypothetical protein
LALIRGSTIDPNTEPTSVTPSCTKLFEASSNHAVYTHLQEMVSKSDAISHYSPTNLENACKRGVIWLKPDTLEPLTNLAVLPAGMRTTRMIQMHRDIAQRKDEEQKLNDANFDFRRKLHLFCTSNLLEVHQALFRTYCTLLDIFFGSKSILYQRVQFIWSFMEQNQRIFQRSIFQPNLIAMVLYAMDVAIQTLLRELSNSDTVRTVLWYLPLPTGTSGTL